MDYAGNSNKAKEEAAKENTPAVPEEKNLEKVVTGEVVVRKQGFGRKFKGLFFGEDFKNVCSYVYEEKIIPGIQNALFDAIVGGADRALWGRRKSPTTHQHPGMRPRIQYNNPDRGRLDPRTMSARLPNQPPHRSQVNRREANDIVLASRDDAKQVLDMMDNCINKYEVVSLADVYEILGLPKATVDQRWGWTNITSADIRQIRDGYLLELPPMEEI